MTLIESLLSESKDGQRELVRQELIVSVTEQIWEAMEQNQASKADLARRLGKSKAHITQLLCGEHNMTLATLADLAAALGLRARVSLASPNPPKQAIASTPVGPASIHWTVVSTGISSDDERVSHATSL
jgi:transcriptional regulator with XRE-family HTH domain